MDSIDAETPNDARRGPVAEVFTAFLKLGLTSFGGPIAHLGYFRTEFVERRRWLDDRAYSDLLALCQFLPGPASSQVGMALGLGRAGWGGMLTAWLGFTLPSAIALILFAYGIASYQGLALSGAVQGLKIVAVAIVAQAVWGMAKNLCPDRPRAVLALVAALITLAMPSTLGQVSAIALAGLYGWARLDPPLAASSRVRSYPVSRGAGMVALLIFVALLVGLPLWAAATASPGATLISGWTGGMVLLGVVFLPAVLVLVAALPFWEALRHRAGIQSAMAGINAGVVGILLSALYDPVWTSAIHSRIDFGLALAAFALLVYGRVPPVFVVVLTGVAGWLVF